MVELKLNMYVSSYIKVSQSIISVNLAQQRAKKIRSVYIGIRS